LSVFDILNIELSVSEGYLIFVIFVLLFFCLIYFKIKGLGHEAMLHRYIRNACVTSYPALPIQAIK
jgi:hypothetical protein